MNPLNYLPPDLTHDMAHIIIRSGVIKLPRVQVSLPVVLNGHVFTNPLGLGAGIDKDAFLTGNLLNLGMGFITIGSVTLRPRQGNPRPRVVKYPGLRAMVNAMGLPSRGFMDVMGRVRELMPRAREHGVNLVLSLAGFSIEEFMLMIPRAVGMGLGIIEINVSSPTYKGSWVKDRDQLSALFREVEGFDALFFIKVPLGLDVDDYRWFVNEASRRGFGLTLCNTLIVKEPRISVGYGGLSGAPIYPLVRALIRKVRSWGFRGPIIGVGGVFDAWQVLDLVRVGANLVGVVTAFAYNGPWAILRLLRGLRVLVKLKRDHIAPGPNG
ncbi:dihydroorotate dehydrogenase [Vulcanisaeta thermophila]|uniref:dihydroorotate dehydrogenase n=1 Tax=Vulcanisaeta thermophila TaxID=867917 RepID=UPI000853B2DD|nr:dihydroorotate oxidase [Vulcanisaeta thermophila]